MDGGASRGSTGIRDLKMKSLSMKTILTASWQRAKHTQKQSGFGLTEAECSGSANGGLSLV